MAHTHSVDTAESAARIRFESFIADGAARFAAPLPLRAVEAQIERTLRELLDVVDADRCALLGGTADEQLAWITCAAYAEGSAHPFPEANFATLFPWHVETVCGRRQPVALVRAADLPPTAETDRQSLAANGIRSMLSIPVSGNGGAAHCLMIQSLQEERAWPEYYQGRLQLLGGVFVDALNRTRAEETQQLEAPHSDLLESVRAIVWRADARTFQTTFVSKEAETILGYPLESWLKVPGFWIDHVHPDDREWVVALSSKATQEHRKHDFEYRMVVADGRTVWLRNIVNVVVDHGQATELVGVTVDITERRQAEFEAARLRAQLSHALRVTSLGELAATLAHELNQPLGAIVSNAEAAQVFLKDRPKMLDPLWAIVEDIAQDGRRAGAIIHRVRRMLQKQPPDMQPLDVRRVVDDVVGLARVHAMNRLVTLTEDVAPGLPAPRGDAVQIQQVLANLISNAMDAVADRPVGMRHVTVRALRDGESGVEFSVADSGTGIPVEMLPQAFDPFFTTKAGGLGMGLPICRTIVESHGGTIHVENNGDGGATVRFTLPADTPEGAA